MSLNELNIQAYENIVFLVEEERRIIIIYYLNTKNPKGDLPIVLLCTPLLSNSLLI